MSTRGTVAHVDIQEVVGGDTFHASLHAYEECFDQSGALFFEFWEQGVFSNQLAHIALPHDMAVEFCAALGKWAASQVAQEKETRP